jgi:hypothetical protein
MMLTTSFFTAEVAEAEFGYSGQLYERCPALTFLQAKHPLFSINSLRSSSVNFGQYFLELVATVGAEELDDGAGVLRRSVVVVLDVPPDWGVGIRDDWMTLTDSIIAAFRNVFRYISIGVSVSEMSLTTEFAILDRSPRRK